MPYALYISHQLCLSEYTDNGSISNLTCDAEKITINFDDSFYNHACLSDKNFLVGKIENNDVCPQATFSVNQGKLEFDIDNCLVEANTTPEEIIFKIDFEIPDSSKEMLGGLILSEGYGSLKYSISCTFDRINQVEATNSVQFVSQDEEFEANVDQEFKIQMKTFDDSSYTNALSYPIVKDYNEELYFQISFDDDALAGQSSNFHLITETCWATPNISQIEQTNVTLIENECESSLFGSILNIVDPRSETTKDEWSSRVFRFPNEEDIVIRCRVRICFEEDDCRRDCTGARKGVRNDVKGKFVEKEISTGILSLKDDDDDKSAGYVPTCYVTLVTLLLGYFFV